MHLQSGKSGKEFQGAVYNSISNQYIPQMTWALLSSKEKGAPPKMLEIRVDRYGKGSNFLYIDKEDLERHIAAVDKYLDWENTARKRSDLLQKDIDEIPSKYISNNLVYSFFSGNRNSHYLLADNATGFGVKGMYAIYFDKVNAIKYKNMLIKFKNNEFMLIETDSIYN